MRVSSPSPSRSCMALPQVCRACPSSWLSVVMDGTGRPDNRSPLMICFRIRAASRTYDRGSVRGAPEPAPPRARSKTASNAAAFTTRTTASGSISVTRTSGHPSPAADAVPTGDGNDDSKHSGGPPPYGEDGIQHGPGGQGGGAGECFPGGNDLSTGGFGQRKPQAGPDYG